MKRITDKRFAALPLDEEGHVDGFQFDGYKRAIALWREKKEAQEFKKLCGRIYQANHQRARYHKYPAVREANKRRCVARRRKNVATRTCLNCGVMWSNVPGLQRGGRPPTKYCSKKCRVQYHNRDLVKKRSREGFWKDNWRRWHKFSEAHQKNLKERCAMKRG